MASGPALLPFQRQLASQLDADRLLILARGLGLRAIVAASLRCYDRSDCLVLVVNASLEDERGMNEEMGMRLRCIGHEMAAKDREKTYKAGGCLSVTSRILIVDLLNKKMDVSKVTGLVILHAESVTPTSVEAFIIRVYRNANKTGFIKAFSDEPEQFTFGIAPLQTVLTQLKLRDVLIYPRFQADVKRDLASKKADVVELHQPLSPAMDQIQTAVLECMEATLGEIKRSNSSLEIDDLNIDSALFRSFDAIIRSHLDPIWHRVSPKTRQLVSDLSTLRKLLSYLVSFDSVSFLRFLETLLESQSDHGTVVGAVRKNRSPWMFTDAADTVFSVARKRAYVKTGVAPSSAGPGGKKPEVVNVVDDDDDEQEGPTEEEELAMREAEAQEAALLAAEAVGMDTSGFRIPALPVPNGKGKEKAQEGGSTAEDDRAERELRKVMPKGLEPVLEELPKWKLLRDVMDEIEQHIWQEGGAGYSKSQGANETILIMCSSSTTCSTIRDYLCSDRGEGKEGSTAGRKLMRKRLREYFIWKSALGKMARNLKASSTGKSGLNASGPASGGDEGEVSAALKRKEQWKRGKAPANKRRRVRGGGSVGAGGDRGGPGPAKASDSDALEAEAGEVADLVDAAVSTGASASIAAEAMENAFDELAFDAYFGLLSVQDLVVIRPYMGDDDDRVLEEVRPRYVVMYEPDPAFVRRVECYRAAHKGVGIRVYFLLYGASVEEQRYLSAIRREKDSFERLIKENATMAIPHEAEVRGDPSEEELLRTVNSRIAGGSRTTTSGPPRVIVDVREFRSSLPSILHAARFDVVPLTLTIGDYVLSSTMCVERKSIADLIQSFNSGRLYQQCELMSIHYKQPILLIEFDLKKSFSLETYEATSAAGPNQSDTDLHAKLVLLTIAFPRLRIIWSSSPYATADIFADLKQNYAEPDAESAALVGLEDAAANAATSSASGTAVAVEGGFTLAPVEMLRSLPGVTTKNYRFLMSKVKNVEALCALSQKEVQDMLGVEAGNTLYRFVNEDSRAVRPA